MTKTTPRLTTYLALLRGINVGGNNIIPMASLRECLEQHGLTNVRTYIQSGNVFFDTPEQPKKQLQKLIQEYIKKQFSADIQIVVFTKSEWQDVIASAPSWWGRSVDQKHNLLVLIPPYDIKQITNGYGDLKNDYEKMAIGLGVIYQSLSWKNFGKTTGGKLASNPIYKQMTVRNFNTANKLLSLF